MQKAKITLHKSDREVIGSITVNLKLDIPKELMQILVDELGKGVNSWFSRIVVHSNPQQTETT